MQISGKLFLGEKLIGRNRSRYKKMTELVKAATINMLNMFKKMGWGKE